MKAVETILYNIIFNDFYLDFHVDSNVFKLLANIKNVLNIYY